LSNKIYTLGWLNWIVAYAEPKAFVELPQTVPLQNAGSVPPPTGDVVEPPPQIYATGGL